MSVTYRLVNWTFKRITRMICRVHDEELVKVPHQGPLIVVANHVNFLEAPILYTHLQPRDMTGFAKAENWDKPLSRWLFEFWSAIPLRRGEADMSAIRLALEALEQRKILAVAPEGTRSNHGRLQRGHPGVVLLALRSGAPMLSMAYYGGERYRENLRRLRRTDFYIKIGRLFTLDVGGVRVTREVRQQMLEEIMLQVAVLLPEEYRGYYGEREPAPPVYLRFLNQGAAAVV